MLGLAVLALLVFPLVVLARAGDHEVHGRSWKTLPREGDMPAADLRKFWADLEELDEIPAVAPTSGLASFPVNESLSQVAYNTSLVPDELQGIFWMKDHPTKGHALFSMIGGDKVFDGNVGLDQPGEYVYASNIRPGYLAVIDTPANRSTLLWMRDKGLEFTFPKFKSNHALFPGDASYFNTHLDGWFKKFPVPAAKAEGWKLWEQAKWELNPKRIHDPAASLCFCSVIYDGPDVLTRNNFGKFAYQFLRVVDGRGVPTRHWQDFKSLMASLNVTRFVKLDSSAADSKIEREAFYV